ncbi:23S rRNA (pseudouridine1915-N3)-methyltransferase [Primorskyibacter sedentarius]|uniref:Ribosomal RNA large subunit methyltransferase H n=1 Tax=Primorskyibacter sedentarius TaxID=745311 RepID=A0A4R3J6D1_9RHOB|nr:23S rRNA (pseudouridine(1915)-N(3))-methyltransferase RlmH [Primorskyibacter sedentarius]TCS60413.1 23S rRNA (pseudouridine1915-N3)-methyltransferase [Primorskyibacter sedentarius]
MRIQLCVVGRLKVGPERSLIDDYLKRFDRIGRGLSLGPATVSEVEDRKGGGMGAEAVLLKRAVPSGARLCVMDERGKAMSSPAFSEMICGWRDQGAQDAAFVIGGADGVDPELRESADNVLSFGKMVWPHMLARVMLAEQLYRAAAIAAGTPYHRA